MKQQKNSAAPVENIYYEEDYQISLYVDNASLRGGVNKKCKVSLKY
ncbi:MAG: hypothetical protein ACI312_05130 [Bacilli bacterium]